MWSYVVTDLITSQVVGRVPFTGVSFTQTLDGKGSFTGSTLLSHPAWSDRLSDDLWRRVIWPVRAGKPVGAFVFNKMPGAGLRDDSRPIGAVHLAQVFMRRVVQDTLVFSGVDQNNILRDLVRYALGRSTLYASAGATLQPVGSTAVPWIRLDSVESGVLRDRLETPGNTDDGYTAQSRKIIGTCMDQLRDLQDGCEFRWLYGLDSTSGLPFMLLDTGGPGNDHKVGRAAGQAPQVMFEFPSNTVADAAYGADGDAIVGRAHVVGQDREGTRPVGTYTDTWLLNQGYPLLESVWTESSVQQQATLDAKAAAHRYGASESLTLTLNGNLPPTFTTYELGDHVLFRATRPDGKKLSDETLRVTGWTVKIPDTGVGETVTPTVDVLP